LASANAFYHSPHRVDLMVFRAVSGSWWGRFRSGEHDISSRAEPAGNLSLADDQQDATFWRHASGHFATP